MTANFEAIRAQALKLNRDERLLLGEILLQSAYAEEFEMDQELLDELQRRIADFESGKVKGIPAEEVFKKLHAKFSNKK